MTLQKLAGKRLLEGGAVAIMALLLAAPAVAMPDQSRERPHDSGGGGDRTAVPRSMDSSPSSPSSGSSARSADGGSGSHDSGGPRTAQPAPGGNDGGGGDHPSRQPPHDGGGGRGGHGGGYYGGGYYRPWGWGGGWWGWGSWWYDAPYYGPGGYPYHPRGGYYDNDALGALDLDVSPGRTQVYLDGRYIGTVDAYDGFPRYLWLERGTYDLAFYLDGYKTISRQISVYPGTVIDIDDRLEEGESVKPEDLVTKTHDRRDARIRDERERGDDMGRDDRDDDGDWRDRVREERERRHDGDSMRDQDRGRDEAGDDDDEDQGNGRGDEKRHGQLQLDIEPGDASVYLDGRFVGTADELDHGLSVNPGKHQVAVVRPGRASREVQVDVSAGQQVELDIELDTAP